MHGLLNSCFDVAAGPLRILVYAEPYAPELVREYTGPFTLAPGMMSLRAVALTASWTYSQPSKTAAFMVDFNTVIRYTHAAPEPRLLDVPCRTVELGSTLSLNSRDTDEADGRDSPVPDHRKAPPSRQISVNPLNIHENAPSIVVDSPGEEKHASSELLIVRHSPTLAPVRGSMRASPLQKVRGTRGSIAVEHHI